MSEIHGKVDAASRRRRARPLSLMVVAAALLVLVSLLAACSGNDDSGTSQETLATMEARRSVVPTSPPSEGSPVGSPGETSGSPIALPAGNADNGKALATSLGCVACHSVDGSKLTGPTWKGLFGHEVKLADGSTVTADETYIHTAIMEPNKQVVEGFSPIMPSFASQVDEQKIADIIAYIKTLQ